MKKKTGFRTKHAKRQTNEKPVPEKVLGMLEKRKKKLEKKIKLMEEETPNNKRAFKKRLESKHTGLESLKKQIKDNRKLLAKELKKRQANDPKPSIVDSIEKEQKEMEKKELFNKIRQAALEASRKRQEEELKRKQQELNEINYIEEYREVV